MSTPDTAAEWDALRDGLPDHQAEVMASHPGRPTPAESVAMGVTPASGAGKGDGGYGPFGSPTGGMP